jgi:hypothetical protein
LIIKRDGTITKCVGFIFTQIYRNTGITQGYSVSFIVRDTGCCRKDTTVGETERNDWFPANSSIPTTPNVEVFTIEVKGSKGRTGASALDAVFKLGFNETTYCLQRAAFVLLHLQRTVMFDCLVTSLVCLAHNVGHGEKVLLHGTFMV